MLFFREALKKYSILINNGFEKMSQLALITKAGYREWKLYRAQNFLNKQFSLIAYNTLKANASARIISSSPRLVVEPLIISLAFILIFIVSDHNNLSNYLPLIAAGVFALQRFMPYIQAAFSGWTYIKSNEKAVYEFLDQIDDTKVFKPITKSKLNLKKISGIVEFSNVGFRYETKKNIFKKFDLRIEAGQFVAVIGESGSGKSTFVNLLLGFLQPFEGKIIPGLICHEKQGASYVPQDIFIFQGTVTENITLGNKEKANFKHIIEVLKIVELEGYFKNLKNGFDNILNQDGFGMSGGQKQRLGIARALYQKPKILILDEATNALDTKTEKKVLENLYKFCKSRKITMIMVTHRKEPIKNCDFVINL